MAVSAKNFKFISPGIRIEEIDRSQIPADEPAIGACLIGRAARGPAFTPVEVRSFSDFVSVFGEPVAGGQSGDIWRDNNYTSPMYATYAAQSWLRNGEALTFVRTLGVESDDATSNGKAGWKIGEGVASGSTATGKGGAYGLLVWASGSGVTPVTGTLAAVWYLETGLIQLTGTLAGSSTSAGTSAVFDSDANGRFTVEFEGTGVAATPLPTSKFTFSLTRSDSKFARKVFNTNPTLLGRSSANSPVGYFLGETFEDHMTSVGITGSNLYGAIVGLAQTTNTSNDGADFRLTALNQDKTVPKSGWVLSQDQSNDTASFSSDMSENINSGRVKKLFRLVGLNDGQWVQRNLKLSIENIRPPIDENVDPFYKFNVVLRQVDDTDTSKQIVESFLDCTLNANSDDYIARKIGDKYVEYDETNNRNVEKGEFDNRSEYVYVELASEYADGFEASLIPYGVTGPTKYRSCTFGSTVSPTITGSTGIILGNNINGNEGYALSANQLSNRTGRAFRVNFPSLDTRTTSSLASVGAYRNSNFGANIRADNTNNTKQDFADLVRIKPAYISNGDQYQSGSLIDFQFVTTLDNVQYKNATSAVAGTSSVLVYDAGSRAAGASLSAKSGADAVLNLSTGAPGLTTLFFGGTDGFDITQSDPLANGAIAANNKENSYEYNTIERAINIVKNPEEVAYNVVAIPGLNNESLNTKLIANTAERADALAVIEYEGSYVPPHEYRYGGASETNGNVNTYITNRKSAGTNSSYAATYFPWVKVRDNINSTDLWVPASVAALGAMSYTDRIQAPWFAPAGFNRGGLSSGISGLPVVSTALKLFKDDRDDLYEVGINPIATFPNEGIVIFGQKTLQIQRSALDRINVRRLMVFLKRGISRIANGVLFEPNVPDTWNNFKNQAIPFLNDVKTRFGLTDYKLVLDETTTTPDLIDQNILYAKLFIKPARAIEFIALDFIITNTGASFDD